MKEIGENSNVVYCREPEDWNEAAWREAGAFTVVFLNFEKSKTIRKAVASALDQDYPLLEMFFMDDASSDNSGDVMEELVRAYRGRHKVSVVRNKKNVGICGQWNAVAKLAKGEWFGMFCADDESYLNRVSVVSELIKKHPSLLGVCTGLDHYDISTGKDRKDLKKYEGIIIANGDDVPNVIANKTWPCGATSFWHRSLFDSPLPSVPFDDLLIKWRLHMKAAGLNVPVWLRDSTLSTVKYFVGEGLWSSVWTSREKGEDDEMWYRRKKATEIKVIMRNIETWLAILDESLKAEVSSAFASVAMDGLLTNYKSLAIAENIKSEEIHHIQEVRLFNDLAAVSGSALSPEKLSRAFCNLTVWLKGVNNGLEDKMMRAIRQLKRSKRRKNRIIFILSIICVFLMMIVLVSVY